LTAPIPSWRTVIATPIRAASSRGAPATAATPPLTMPSRTDGKGWVSRTHPASQSGAGRRLSGGGSDVDELGEVRDEVVDQPLATVRHLRSDPGDEGVQGDRRHHQGPVPIASHDRRRPTA